MLAQSGKAGRYNFPRPLLKELDREGPDRYAFSFSGLKTAVLRAVRASRDLAAERADMARGFQDAMVEVLAAKTADAAVNLGYSRVMLGGGVACNQVLVERVRSMLSGDATVAVASNRLEHRQRGHDRRGGRLAPEPRRIERLGSRAQSRSAIPRSHHSRCPHRRTPMNVYPLVWRFPVPLLGHIEITGYGIMMMVGFLMGGWLIALELRRRGLHEEYAADITVAAVIGGIIGAKLWYWAMNGGSLFSRGGLVWYGGFLGGAAAVIINGWRKRVPLRWTFQIAAPSLAAAYALGRIGCFIVNDDYGRPTNLPWGVKFPQGLPPSTAENMTSLFGIPMPPGHRSPDRARGASDAIVRGRHHAGRLRPSCGGGGSRTNRWAGCSGSICCLRESSVS